MKIAFVGKGGAGKTTVSSLFCLYYSKKKSVLAIDADINMHMAELLGLNATSSDLLLSETYPSDKIRTWLRGDNSRIKNNAEFKKSTPPGRGSRIIDITDNNWFINNYTRPISKNLHLATVGSYSENGLASSCYHNNLAILENILSHTNDSGVVGFCS